MGMFDEIKVKQNLQIPDDLKNLDINWKDYKFQTKDLDNCLSEYFISEDGFLYEHIIEREYIPYTEEERKYKDHKPWNIWKDVIEKGSHDKKIEDYHGTIKFYTYETFDNDYDFSLEFTAYFIYGKLDKIVLLEFEKQTSRSITNNSWLEKIKQDQKKPWNIFKKYASYVGWKFFWRKVSNFCYKLSKLFSKIQMFIIKNII